MRTRLLILLLFVTFSSTRAAAQTCSPGNAVPLIGLSFVSQQADAFLIGFNEYTNPSSPKKKYRTKSGAGSTSFDLFWSQDRSCTSLRWQETHAFSGSTTYDKTTGALSDTLTGSMDDNPCVMLRVTRTTRENSLSGACAACWWSPYDQKATAANKMEFLLEEDTEADAENRALPRAIVGTSNVAYRTSRAGDFLFSFRRVTYNAVFNVRCAGDYEVTVHTTARKRNDPSSPVVRQAIVTSRRFESGVQNVEGTLVPEEYDVDYAIESVEARVPCANDAAGSGSFELGSVRVSLSLGRGIAGLSAGSLTLDAIAISPAIYTPALLVPVVADGVEVIRTATGVVRQVRSPQALADIVVINETAYEVSFYSAGQIGPQDAATRLYAVSGAAYRVFRFENPDPAGTLNRLRVSETHGGISRLNDYGFDAGTGAWSLVRGGGLRRETEAVTTVNGDTVKTRTVRDAVDAVVSKVARTYRTYPWGQELIREVIDPDGAALTSTYEFYDTVSSTDPNYRRLRQRTAADGDWERFTYAANGRVLKAVRPFLNADPSTTDEALCRVNENWYDSMADSDGDGVAEGRTTTISRLLGQETGRAYRIDWSKPVSLGGDLCRRRSEIIATEVGAEWNAPANLVVETLFQTAGPLAGRERRSVRPDGTVTLSSYAMGPNGTLTTVIRAGVPNAARDEIIDGRRTTTTMNARGFVIGESTEDIASGLSLDRWSATEFDPAGRVTRRDYTDGTYATRTYDCCGLAAERDRWGNLTTYGYDALGRHIETTGRNLTMRTTLDAEGRVRATVRVGSDGSEVVQETNFYDLAGRLIESRDAMERRMIFSEVYAAVSGQTTRTTTNPDGSTAVVVTARDGSRLSVSGNAVAPHAFEYGVEAAGVFMKDIAVGVDASGQPTTTEWVKTYTDLVGRPARIAFPDGASEQFGYNQAGQLIRQSDPDGVTRLFAYNLRGEREITAVDMNGNGRIDPAGPDRIVQRSTRVGLKNEGAVTHPVVRTETQVWESDNADLPVVAAVAEQSVDGLLSWQTVRGLTTAFAVVPDGVGGRTQTATTPDGLRTTAIYRGARLVSSATATAAGTSLGSVTYTYDAHGRVSAVNDARTGTTSYTYFADDRLKTLVTPDPDPARSGSGYDPQVTSYLYDAAGRVQSVTHPDGAVAATTYWPSGAVRRVSGARAYPVEYTYDPQGRVKTLTTWQNFAANTGRSVTTWNYDPARGWPTEKRYSDNTGPRFIYSASGRPLSRTWARGAALTTTYGYNAAGDLTGVRYSDQTPGVTLSYDRTGRVTMAQDAAGTRAFTYHASGQLEDEGYTSGLLAGVGLDRSFDALHRLSGLAVLTGPSVIDRASYTYDPASRLATVTSGQNSVAYEYLPESGLVRGVTSRNSGVVRLVTTKAYDRLNRLESAQAVPIGAAPFAYGYSYNGANQRTRAIREDQAYWDYGYDPLGQVITGGKKLADGTPVIGHDFGWTYDDIGNRKTASGNGSVSAYTVNSLNQYSERTVPGRLDVLGAAAPGATVTIAVDGGAPQSVTRQGELYFKPLPVANAAGPQRVQLKLSGVKNLAGPNGEDAVAELATTAVLARSPEVFVYDADGNLTADGKWVYAWDAENRLIAMETNAAVITAGVPRQRLEFSYDHSGRRIAKKVLSGAVGGWTVASHTLYVYDGWTVVAELDAIAGNAAMRTYTWGTDLSGTRDGAGGVGGLLLFADRAGSTHFVADDGRGNIAGAVDAATGAVSARYDYNAFGEMIQQQGAVAALNPWRFSTKYADAETGLIYFGYRYLDAGRGRWISRDPYAESGGANLYGLLDNAPTEWIDPLGLALYAFDGTNNDGYRDVSLGQETNVFALFDVYEGLKAYAPGVGTNDGLLNPVGLTFGLGGQARITNLLIKAEEFILKGDLVADIVGFSRGAAQARAFANKLSEKYPCMKIRWIGLFDTVASEGLPNDVNIGYQLGIPRDTGSVFHLTAGGERRAKTFALTSIRPGPVSPIPNPDFREVEVPGAAHSDVGGGYSSNRGLANLSLLMMWESGRASGVPFGPLPSRYSNYVGTPHDSRWLNDKVVEFLSGQPRARKVYYHP